MNEIIIWKLLFGFYSFGMILKLLWWNLSIRVLVAASHHSTSSLLLSRLDTESSSIFICQIYQMSRRCCGHAVAQQASARTGLRQEGNTVSRTDASQSTRGGIHRECDAAEVLRTCEQKRRKSAKSERCARLGTSQQPRALPFNERSLAWSWRKTKSAAMNKLEVVGIPGGNRRGGVLRQQLMWLQAGDVLKMRSEPQLQ